MKLAWSFVSGPSSTNSKESLPKMGPGVNRSELALSGLVIGVYIFNLTGTDDVGNTATAAVKITVNASSTTPPQP
jgi:hypothetical protein